MENMVSLPTQGGWQRFVNALFKPDDIVLIRLIESWVEGGKKKAKEHRRSSRRLKKLQSESLFRGLSQTATRIRPRLSDRSCPFLVG
jgi:hypothetical protein